MKETIKEIREAHERIGKLLSQMEAAGVPTVEHDPLEGKAVYGFSGGKDIGLNYGEHHLWYSATDKIWKVTHRVSGKHIPHHLTRVNSRTVGRFYLIEDQDGSEPFDFGLYLGDKYVRWIEDANYPLFIAHSFTGLTMYEVTPTEQ